MKTLMLLLTLSSFSSVTLSSTPPAPRNVLTLRAKNTTADNVLRIYNWEDYIAVPEDEEEDGLDVIEEFKVFYEETYGETVDIVYDTFATNEDMYNIIKLNGANYDLIAPSDYMIQRMIKEEMLEQFDVDSSGNYEKIPNYNDYASHYHRNLFETQGWSEYAVGYMWGTMGLLYNTDVAAFEDMQRWSILWEDTYAKKISIKDAMREAYLVGLLKVHEEQLLTLADDYQSGEISAQDYNDQLSDLLNDVSPETIKEVDLALRALKNNIYGLEVDQGKTDMIKGTIAINTAWSGDAVYSIYEAAAIVEETGEGSDLRYAIPVEGSNIWFDGWVMPKGANTELAQIFVDYLSTPEIAVANMEYIGYTSFIAGDEVLEYVESYDEVVEDDGYELDLTYFFEGTVTDRDEVIITIDNDYIGGQLHAQYPTHEEVIRSAVMRDFGESNKLIIDMWANFKATEIQPWMIVFSVIVVLAVGSLLTYNQFSKHHSVRRKRK